MTGKHKCRVLKMIRRIIAADNAIDYHFDECKYEGECFGFCEKCDAEVRYLERELRKRVEQGHCVTLASISYPSFLDSLIEDAKKPINLTENKDIKFGDAENNAFQKEHNGKFSSDAGENDAYADEDLLDSFLIELECGLEEDNIALRNFKHLGKYGVEALSLRIEELNLSDRTYNCLARAGICTVEDITCRTEEDMIKIRALGKRSLDEITYLLHSLGLDFKYDEE